MIRAYDVIPFLHATTIALCFALSCDLPFFEDYYGFPTPCYSSQVEYYVEVLLSEN